MTATTTGTGKPVPRRSPSKGASSTNGKTPHVEWHTLKLAVPVTWEDAGGDLGFAIEENETSAAVKAIFGDEQYVQIRERLKTEGLKMSASAEALNDLLTLVFEKWNLDAGE